MLKILKEYNEIYNRYSKNKKVLSDLRNDLEDLIQEQNSTCENCNRKNPTGENSDMAPYKLVFRSHQENLLIKRKRFRFVAVDNASDDLVVLCLECSNYLTNHDNKVARSFNNTWPSFIWSLLSDRDVLDVYGQYMWRFVPEKWRYWWIDSLNESDLLVGVTIDVPVPIFKDITSDISDIQEGYR